MKINITGIESEFDRINKEVDHITRERLVEQTLGLLTELRADTPVDTGLAKQSWEVLGATPVGNNIAIDIRNPVPYIGDLNRGSSKQAPAHFIEKAALKYGTPIGTIAVETS